jgi:hypothetical protein
MRVDIFCPSEYLSESSFLSFLLRTLKPYNLRTPYESEEVFALTAQLSKQLRLRYTAGPAVHSYAILSAKLVGIREVESIKIDIWYKRKHV